MPELEAGLTSLVALIRLQFMRMETPPTFHPANLPHLRAALDFSGRGGVHACVLWSASLVLDLRGAEVVFGVVQAAPEERRTGAPGESDVPFIHAWVAYRGWVYAPTLIQRMRGQLRPIEPETYYHINGVHTVRTVPRPQFEAISRRWRLSAACLHQSARAGNPQIVENLLSAAGMKYFIHEDGTLLPR